MSERTRTLLMALLCGLLVASGELSVNDSRLVALLGVALAFCFGLAMGRLFITRRTKP